MQLKMLESCPQSLGASCTPSFRLQGQNQLNCYKIIKRFGGNGEDGAPLRFISQLLGLIFYFGGVFLLSVSERWRVAVLPSPLVVGNCCLKVLLRS